MTIVNTGPEMHPKGRRTLLCLHFHTHTHTHKKKWVFSSLTAAAEMTVWSCFSGVLIVKTHLFTFITRLFLCLLTGCDRHGGWGFWKRRGCSESARTNTRMRGNSRWVLFDYGIGTVTTLFRMSVGITWHDSWALTRLLYPHHTCEFLRAPLHWLLLPSSD